ncbi:hypothetical protein SETIT_4G157200v2 [Setaria italica]|uniref:Uncharacterized protein n=1 Tax=Setaria italica TaxID=4555 RepID=A0A368QUQ8_SETIT|nr:hypothetical protein SETIT_4G157200v2 [Setaria italica]
MPLPLRSEVTASLSSLRGWYWLALLGRKEWSGGWSLTCCSRRRRGRRGSASGWSCGGSRTGPAGRYASPSDGVGCSRRPTSSPCSATHKSHSLSSSPLAASTSSPSLSPGDDVDSLHASLA